MINYAYYLERSIGAPHSNRRPGRLFEQTRYDGDHASVNRISWIVMLMVQLWIPFSFLVYSLKPSEVHELYTKTRALSSEVAGPETITAIVLIHFKNNHLILVQFEKVSFNFNSIQNLSSKSRIYNIYCDNKRHSATKCSDWDKTARKRFRKIMSTWKSKCKLRQDNVWECKFSTLFQGITISQNVKYRFLFVFSQIVGWPWILG